ncbi:hypothetical protein HMPREF9182_0052 [Streptococcus sp. oral taxon 056 str. F0418]|uniref:helix-turn-helix domain-containing protein n=1 Tax=Streptococcus sp. oral taxon 056 TaxID=712620 RepID=UPI0002180AFC|nr:helix-turn-helix domain-containing protein [Streptococcus sp. oral taxon 056]EGP66029.1 hypothetical protein HMPREF9182_0052 [Streptococcus sp. oral taxon 056 str. F0418]
MAISYQPFYQTLLRKDVSEYYLIKIEKISANTLYRMKQGEPITTKTIDKLCEILECNVEDIIEYINTEE